MRGPPPRARPRLRLLRGGRDDPLAIAGVRVDLVDARRRADVPGPPPPRVIEQDTGLLLDADVPVLAPTESLAHLALRALNAPRVEPGTVLVRGRLEPRLYAVVLDLDRDPACREAWVARALESVLRIAARRRFPVLAMPLLGTVHGRLPPARAAALLGVALARAEPGAPRRVLLRVGPESRHAVRAALSASR